MTHIHCSAIRGESVITHFNDKHNAWCIIRFQQIPVKYLNDLRNKTGLFWKSLRYGYSQSEEPIPPTPTKILSKNSQFKFFLPCNLTQFCRFFNDEFCRRQSIEDTSEESSDKQRNFWSYRESGSAQMKKGTTGEKKGIEIK